MSFDVFISLPIRSTKGLAPTENVHCITDLSAFVVCQWCQTFTAPGTSAAIRQTNSF